MTNKFSLCEKKMRRNQENRKNSPIRTTVMCTRFRWCSHNDFHTRIRSITFSSTFFTIHMTKRISIILHKLIMCHNFCEMTFPESLSVFMIQSLSILSNARISNLTVSILTAPFKKSVYCNLPQCFSLCSRFKFI